MIRWILPGLENNIGSPVHSKISCVRPVILIAGRMRICFIDLLWVSIWYIEILFLSLRPNWTKHLNMNKIYTINDIKKQNALVTCGIPVVHVHWFSGFI